MTPDRVARLLSGPKSLKPLGAFTWHLPSERTKCFWKVECSSHLTNELEARIDQPIPASSHSPSPDSPPRSLCICAGYCLAASPPPLGVAVARPRFELQARPVRQLPWLRRSVPSRVVRPTERRRRRTRRPHVARMALPASAQVVLFGGASLPPHLRGSPSPGVIEGVTNQMRTRPRMCAGPARPWG